MFRLTSVLISQVLCQNPILTDIGLEEDFSADIGFV